MGKLDAAGINASVRDDLSTQLDVTAQLRYRIRKLERRIEDAETAIRSQLGDNSEYWLRWMPLTASETQAEPPKCKCDVHPWCPIHGSEANRGTEHG